MEALIAGFVVMLGLGVAVFPRLQPPRFDGYVTYNSNADADLEIPEARPFVFGAAIATATPRRLPVSPPVVASRSDEETITQPPNDSLTGAQPESTTSTLDDAPSIDTLHPRKPSILNRLVGALRAPFWKPTLAIEDPIEVPLDELRSTIKPIGLDEALELDAAHTDAPALDSTTIATTEAPDVDKLHVDEPVDDAVPIEQHAKGTLTLANFFSRQRTDTVVPSEVEPAAQDAANDDGAQTQAAADNVIAFPEGHVFDWMRELGIERPMDAKRRMRLMRVQGALRNESARQILAKIAAEDPELASEASMLLESSASAR